MSVFRSVRRNLHAVSCDGQVWVVDTLHQVVGVLEYNGGSRMLTEAGRHRALLQHTPVWSQVASEHDEARGGVQWVIEWSDDVLCKRGRTLIQRLAQCLARDRFGVEVQ